jgi:hypothetical protein
MRYLDVGLRREARGHAGEPADVAGSQRLRQRSVRWPLQLAVLTDGPTQVVVPRRSAVHAGRDGHEAVHRHARVADTTQRVGHPQELT